MLCNLHHPCRKGGGRRNLDATTKSDPFPHFGDTPEEAKLLLAKYIPVVGGGLSRGSRRFGGSLSDRLCRGPLWSGMVVRLSSWQTGGCQVCLDILPGVLTQLRFWKVYERRVDFFSPSTHDSAKSGKSQISGANLLERPIQPA